MIAGAIENEIKAFDASLSRLRIEIGSTWAVFIDGQVKATFAEFDKAAEYAVRELGNRDYIIRHTNEHTAHIPFIAIDA